jgi:rRNA maturation endonuclease Nob1
MAWKAQNEISATDAKRIDGSILQVDNHKKNMIYQLGEAFYKANKDNADAVADYKVTIDNINKLEFNRKVWINRKMKLQGMRICEGCGNVLPYESAFCNRCGIKLEAVAEDLLELEGEQPNSDNV